MAKGGCVDGELVDASFLAPMPWIGLYIATATLVCFIFMTYDFLHGLIQRKPFLPCKWFKLNALTLTLLQVATKIPVDLTASMARAEDQLSKLTGTALLCTTLGFCIPSLGTMGTSERYSNMVALSMIVISVVINVCVQMHTGPIFAFAVEHIIIIICMLLLLLLMWSSAIACSGQIESSESRYKSQTMREWDSSKKTYHVRNVNGLGELLKKLHKLNYTGNPQSLLCETSHHHAFGFLCALSALVVIEATLRTFKFKSTVPYCRGADDYKWSIFFVIVTQLATIAVGTLCIIWRWCSFVRHTDYGVLYVDPFDLFFGQELEYVKFKTLSFRVCGINDVLQLLKDGVIEVLIFIQITMLYKGMKWIFGGPTYCVGVVYQKTKKFCFEPTVEAPQPNATDLPAVQEIQDHEISSVSGCEIFKNWIIGMAEKDYKRHYQTPEKPRQFISINDQRIGKKECIAFGRTLLTIHWRHVRLPTRQGKPHIDNHYKVSCLSVLVLSKILKELTSSYFRETNLNPFLHPDQPPSGETQFLKDSSRALDELFEIIYYVDQKTLGDETRLSLTKMVWANWKNPKHWFHETISNAFKKRTQRMISEKSNLGDVHHARQVLKHARQAIKRYSADGVQKDRPLTGRLKLLTLKEVFILCKFIMKEKHGTIKDMIDFIEKSFVKMLHFTLSTLPQAILKEIEGDYPYGICEGNVRKALKFFAALESLGNEIKWSWEHEHLHVSEENAIQRFVDASDSGSEDEAEASSTGADRWDGNSRFASFAACLCCKQDGSAGRV